MKGINFATYPLVIPFMCEHKVFQGFVDFSQLQIEVRCQLVSQGFFVNKLKIRIERKTT